MSGYVYADGLVSREVLAARSDLNEGLTRLRLEMGSMLSLAVRGDGSTKRTRNRPHANEAPGRHTPSGGNSKAVGGRVAAPARPTMPAQPGPADAGLRPGGTDTDTAVIPAVPATDTVVIPAVSATDTVVIPAVPATEKSTGTGGPPPGYPSRPDPSDPATEVWKLVERAQAGEAEAFGLIYDRYVDTVFRFVYFRVGNRQLAEDLTSDTFLRALKRIGSFTWQGRDLGAWLVTIARNLVADHFKSGRYRLEVTTGDVLDADREDRGPEGSPEAAVVDHITNVALLTAVKQLNPEQQECIVLRFLQGFSVAETAKAMGKNEGAIKALQYRAVRALARLLPDGFQP
ncbi:ECF subfamily RNA polymerase sigma factor, BldN family [Polymorphospora rubra]|uniref:ECF subfamily RNA polymerase sigma factor, BldN family n=1 Tax=Polymorphospora rubra TaxID=338584 RepID=UPI003F4CE9BF